MPSLRNVTIILSPLEKEKEDGSLPSPPLRDERSSSSVGTAAQESPHHRLRALYNSGSLASPGQSFQFKVKHYGLNCIMVSFPTKKKVGTESNSNEGRLLVSKTQSRRLTSDPAARLGVYIYIYVCIDAYTHARAHIRAIRSIHLHVWPRWTSRGADMCGIRIGERIGVDV